MHQASPSPISTPSGPHGAHRTVARPSCAVAAFACLLILLAGLEARAQQGSLGTQPRTAAGAREDDSYPSWGREEMLKKVELKRLELAHKENLVRAKESATLGAELRQSFERSKGLGAAEQKMLGRLEKLARAIREQAGGDDDREGGKDLPGDPATSFAQLQKLSEELNSKVEKTPRHVVSTAVISTANKLLGLIRHIRTSFK